MILEFIAQHADRLMQVGLHLLWQGTVIAILASVASRFICKSPRQRATLYLGSLVALSLCVPATLMTLENPSPEEMTPHLTATPSPEMAPPSMLLTADSPSPIEAEESPLSLSFWIIGMYLVGLLLMMARVIRGYLWSNKVRRNGQAVHEDPWSDALTQAVTAMKLRTKPAMIWSSKITSPVVTGILRPMIVLPVSLMTGLPKEQAIAVISHELAHLRRFDHHIVVFQRLLEALFFFHPAVWFLSRRLDQEREKACDDLVVNSGHNRADYAEALVKIAADHQAGLALAAASNDLKARVFRILNHPQPTTVRVNGGGWLTIAAAIGGFGFLSLSPALSDEKEVVEPEKLEVVETGKATILKKLKMQIPEINFQNTTLVEAVEFLRMSSIELDPTPEQSEKGINWVVRRRAGPINEIKIDSLAGKNLTFKEVLEAICQKTKTRYKVAQYAVTILPQLAPGEEEYWIEQRAWKTLPDFPALITATGISPRSKSIAGHLKALGVEFPKDASASYAPASNTLTVCNTPKNFALIEKIVKASSESETAKVQRASAKSSEAERLASEAHDKLLTQRSWATPPDFLDRLVTRKEGTPAIPTEDCLKEYGVTFVGNSAASIIKKRNTLVVRNTQENLKLVDALVKAARDPDFKKNREEAAAAAKRNAQELQEIIVPEVNFMDTTLAEAVESLRALELDASKKGVNINIGGDGNLPQTKIESLHLINVPFTVVLQYLCDTTKTRYSVNGRNITILPRKE